MPDPLLASYEKLFCGFSQPSHHTLSRASHDTRSWVNVETHVLAINFKSFIKVLAEVYGSGRFFSVVTNDAIRFSAENLNVTQNKHEELKHIRISCQTLVLTACRCCGKTPDQTRVVKLVWVSPSLS